MTTFKRSIVFSPKSLASSASAWCQAGRWVHRNLCLGGRTPDMVDAIAPISGSARTATYNKTFLASLRTALTSDAAYNDGFYTDKPPIKGIRT